MENQALYCPKCNHPVSSEDTACPSCGVPFIHEEQAESIVHPINITPPIPVTYSTPAPTATYTAPMPAPAKPVIGTYTYKAPPKEASNEEKTPINKMSVIAVISSVVLPLLGVILGVMSLGKIKSSNEEGKGYAIAAIVAGSLLTLSGLAKVFITFVFVLSQL